MKLITIVALLLGISTHALATIPVPAAQIDEEFLEQQPRLRGSDPNFFEDIMLRGRGNLATCTTNW